ncbi:conserved Plasmodium protein, unknown function [Plasmodium chabaudi chabaudi]|uniref:Uncharacterized protein n=1 Tax=Plasmodium chabaudi chabaudi TaxID=31271 RepID=A0A1D3LER3_PLACU|nr:conserved Plasmodium protein, unknown function [Plasmodium chabaudi chabaudi]
MNYLKRNELEALYTDDYTDFTRLSDFEIFTKDLLVSLRKLNILETKKKYEEKYVFINIEERKKPLTPLVLIMNVDDTCNFIKKYSKKEYTIKLSYIYYPKNKCQNIIPFTDNSYNYNKNVSIVNSFYCLHGNVSCSDVTIFPSRAFPIERFFFLNEYVKIEIIEKNNVDDEQYMSIENFSISNLILNSLEQALSEVNLYLPTFVVVDKNNYIYQGHFFISDYTYYKCMDPYIPIHKKGNDDIIIYCNSSSNNKFNDEMLKRLCKNESDKNYISIYKGTGCEVNYHSFKFYNYFKGFSLDHLVSLFCLFIYLSNIRGKNIHNINVYLKYIYYISQPYYTYISRSINLKNVKYKLLKDSIKKKQIKNPKKNKIYLLRNQYRINKYDKNSYPYVYLNNIYNYIKNDYYGKKISMCYFKRKAKPQNKHLNNNNPYEYKKDSTQNYLYNIKNNILYKPNYCEESFKKFKITNILSGDTEINDIGWISNIDHFCSLDNEDEHVNSFFDTSLAFYSSSLEPNYDLMNNPNDKKKVNEKKNPKSHTFDDINKLCNLLTIHKNFPRYENNPYISISILNFISNMENKIMNIYEDDRNERTEIGKNKTNNKINSVWKIRFLTSDKFKGKNSYLLKNILRLYYNELLGLKRQKCEQNNNSSKNNNNNNSEHNNNENNDNEKMKNTDFSSIHNYVVKFMLLKNMEWLKDSEIPFFSCFNIDDEPTRYYLDKIINNMFSNNKKQIYQWNNTSCKYSKNNYYNDSSSEYYNDSGNCSQNNSSNNEDEKKNNVKSVKRYRLLYTSMNDINNSFLGKKIQNGIALTKDVISNGTGGGNITNVGSVDIASNKNNKEKNNNCEPNGEMETDKMGNEKKNESNGCPNKSGEIYYVLGKNDIFVKRQNSWYNKKIRNQIRYINFKKMNEKIKKKRIENAKIQKLIKDFILIKDKYFLCHHEEKISILFFYLISHSSNIKTFYYIWNQFFDNIRNKYENNEYIYNDYLYLSYGPLNIYSYSCSILSQCIKALNISIQQCKINEMRKRIIKKKELNVCPITNHIDIQKENPDQIQNEKKNEADSDACSSYYINEVSNITSHFTKMGNSEENIFYSCEMKSSTENVNLPENAASTESLAIGPDASNTCSQTQISTTCGNKNVNPVSSSNDDINYNNESFLSIKESTESFTKSVDGIDIGDEKKKQDIGNDINKQFEKNDNFRGGWGRSKATIFDVKNKNIRNIKHVNEIRKPLMLESFNKNNRICFMENTIISNFFPYPLNNIELFITKNNAITKKVNSQDDMITLMYDILKHCDENIDLVTFEDFIKWYKLNIGKTIYSSQNVLKHCYKSIKNSYFINIDTNYIKNIYKEIKMKYYKENDYLKVMFDYVKENYNYIKDIKCPFNTFFVGELNLDNLLNLSILDLLECTYKAFFISYINTIMNSKFIYIKKIQDVLTKMFNIIKRMHKKKNTHKFLKRLIDESNKSFMLNKKLNYYSFDHSSFVKSYKNGSSNYPNKIIQFNSNANNNSNTLVCPMRHGLEGSEMSESTYKLGVNDLDESNSPDKYENMNESERSNSVYMDAVYNEQNENSKNNLNINKEENYFKNYYTEPEKKKKKMPYSDTNFSSDIKRIYKKRYKIMFNKKLVTLFEKCELLFNKAVWLLKRFSSKLNERTVFKLIDIIFESEEKEVVIKPKYEKYFYDFLKKVYINEGDKNNILEKNNNINSRIHRINRSIASRRIHRRLKGRVSKKNMNTNVNTSGEGNNNNNNGDINNNNLNQNGDASSKNKKNESLSSQIDDKNNMINSDKLSLLLSANNKEQNIECVIDYVNYNFDDQNYDKPARMYSAISELSSTVSFIKMSPIL